MGGNSNRVEDYSGFACQGELTTQTTTQTQVHISRSPHEICLPPQETTIQKLRHRVSDIFFPDRPLHMFKDKNWVEKFILALQYLLPIFQWGPNYNLKQLRSDVISGLTIASLAIPQGISYAKLANLPPVIGLYSSFVPPLIYSILGSSRHLAVGPVSIASLVMGTMLNQAVPYAEDPGLYLKLAFTSTFFAGLFHTSLGLLRLGFVIDFLSKATLIGFTAGAAMIVSLQQLKGLLGMVHFTGKMQIIPVVDSALAHKEEWVWQNVLMGFCFLVFLLGARQVSMKKPKLFWISAAAPLLSVIISTIITFIIKPDSRTIPVVGYLPKGLNPPSLNMLTLHGPYLALTVKTGIVSGILSLTEGIAVGRTFATLENYQVDGNKEMMAIGLMNMAGSCCSCYVTTGSFSRSAVNYNSGAKTALSNVIMATAVLVTLLFLMPLFHYTPNVILAAIIITAVIGLIDYQAAFHLWQVDKLDFIACLTAFFGVLLVSVPYGLAISVGISVFKILLHVTRPNTMALGNFPGTQIYHNLGRYRDALRIPSFLILAVESPIYFANSSYLQERIMRWVREEEEQIKANNETALKFVILDMTAVTAIDTSGVDFLRELRNMLERKTLQLVLANPAGHVTEKLHHSKTLELFGGNGVYLTVAEAVADISSRCKSEP